VVLLFAAAVLGGIAWQTWSVIHRQRRRMEFNRAVNFLVLAKASVLVGALVAGVYAGYGLHYLDDLAFEALAQRVLRSGVAVVGGIAIVVAGLLLERACTVPGGGAEDEESGEADDDHGGESDRDSPEDDDGRKRRVRRAPVTSFSAVT
jgi:lysylphosphatidylglycerol synthetase-like protein (DUF2156 family)